MLVDRILTTAAQLRTLAQATELPSVEGKQRSATVRVVYANALQSVRVCRPEEQDATSVDDLGFRRITDELRRCVVKQMQSTGELRRRGWARGVDPQSDA